MLLMVEKGITGGISNKIHQHAKAGNKKNDYDKNKESSYLNHWDINNSYGWTISAKSPVNNFEWLDETCQFNEDFIKKTIMKKVMKDIFLKLMGNTQKIRTS